MPYEIEFLSVGESNGDAICLRYGSEETGYTIHVVDGGYTETGDTIVNHVNTFYGANPYIDHVVLSHADRDHASGLLTVLEQCDVGTLWMNRPWLYAEEIVDRFHGNFTAQGLRQRIRDEYDLLVKLEDIATRRGIGIQPVFAGHTIGAFTVLAPLRTTYLELIPDFDRTPTSKAAGREGLYGAMQTAFRGAVAELQRWFETWDDEKLSDNPPATSASNESSLVQLGILDGQRFLLTADAGPRALSEAANVAAHLNMHGPLRFMQIPHHGSRRNVTPTVLNQWLGEPLPEGSEFRGTAYCSVGTDKPEYPRNRVRNAFLRRGFGVYPCRSGYIRHAHGLEREGLRPLESLPFISSYEE